MNAMKTSLIALALGIASGIAGAADYVVVRSTDASIAKGTVLAAGARVALAAGATLTLVSPGGEVVTVKGAAGGAQVPGVAGPGDSAASAALAAIVTRPPPRRSFGAMRGGEECPAADSLQTMEQILAASRQKGCGSVAQAALEAYVDKARGAPGAAAPAVKP
ncbi:MAG: hypothetical protein EBS39_07280 [Gammaproteobacteria bacterium]|nr:hypothetical protein [Gammaproteobacteria bacterium]